MISLLEKQSYFLTVLKVLMSFPFRRDAIGFFQGWKRNFVREGVWGLVLFPPLFLFLILDGLPIWLPMLVGVVWVVVMIPWAWKVYWGYDERHRPPPPTAEQLWEVRFQEVADSTDGLPHGLTLTRFCQEHEERVLKKALHALNGIPPGRRHLRVVLQELL